MCQIKNKLREQRAARSWSQEKLAEMTGLSIRTIQRIEKGDQVSKETLTTLAAVFEISVDSLIG